jgi:myo-inositol-1(or 4)-monophosphatase
MRFERAELAKQAARAGGKALLSVVPDAGIVAKEGRGNFVTAGDLASEKAILDLIKKYFPGDQILSEETESAIPDLLQASNLWVIDPIDGTNNFRNGRNYSAVSVGYVEKGVSKIGAVFDPFRNELFFAESGKGATVNETPLQVSTLDDLTKGTVTADNSYDPAGTRFNMELFLKIKPSPWLLVKGSAVLGICDVAAKRTDLYFQTCLKPWDNAAAMIIAKESGAILRDLTGNEPNFLSPEMVVGNEYVVNQFLNFIKA